MSIDHRPHITFLLGKPFRISSVVAHVIQRLHHKVPMITVYRPQPGIPLPPLVFQADLVVQRGLPAAELESAIQLELAMVRCINSPIATHAISNRANLMALLAAAALPVPKTMTAATWEEVIEITDKRPAAIKGLDGRIGRGAHVLLTSDGRLPHQAPFGGPFIVQEYIAADPMVHKLYVAGNHTRELRKLSNPLQRPHIPAVAIDRTPHLSSLARLAGKALGIEIYGVDILDGPSGPVIIDVNAFPGFRDVPDAARLIADHLLATVMTLSGGRHVGPTT